MTCTSESRTINSARVLPNDASACLQLIVQQLNGLEQSQAMLRLLNNCSIDQLVEMSRDGLTEIKSTLSQEK